MYDLRIESGYDLALVCISLPVLELTFSIDEMPFLISAVFVDPLAILRYAGQSFFIHS